MKVYIFIIFYIFTSVFCVLAEDSKIENPIDNIVAIVNNEIILNSDVNETLLLFKKEGKNFSIPFSTKFLREKVIQKLIVDALILEEANRMNITVTKEQINAVIKTIAFKKNISVLELKNYILFQDLKNHFYYDNYIKKIEKLLKIKIIQDYELHKRVNVSEKEVNILLKKLIQNNTKSQKINLSYILLPTLKKYSNDIIDSKKKILEEIVNKLQKGYDFEKLLIKFKKNKSKFLIKKMFWTNSLDLKNYFSRDINIFKKGQIIGPVLGNKGFYILKINDIKNYKENITTEFYMQHLLIKPSILLNDKQSKINIFNIYKKIKEGIYSFDDAVKYLSHDSYSFDKKGNLGWISEEVFNLNIKKELLHLNINEISKPIKSNFGWHIFKILDKRQVDQFYNLKKKEAYKILLDQKIKLEKNNWIENLKNISYIKIIRT